jgi:hypothetical protein
VITQPIPHYEQAGALIYEEDFEDGQATGWVTDGMEVIQLPGGNHVYLAEDAFPFFLLPEGVLDYAVEARIMQPAGSSAAAGVGVRAPSADGCAYYFSYIDFAGGWLNLAENTPRCEENSGPGALRTGYQFTFAQDVWYTLALEASGTTMSVYMDRELVGSGQDDTYRSNILLLWSWSGEPGSHVIYFDDVRIWSLE